MRISRTPRASCRAPGLLSLCVVAALAANHASGAARIVAPTEAELLYGKTRLLAAVEAGETGVAVRVLFYLDHYSRPICVDDQPPYSCEFDAGTSLLGHRIRIKAVDAAGRLIGTDAVETLAFPEPERVVRRTLEVPVIVTSATEPMPDLASADLDCRYAGQRCRVVAASKLAETTRFPISLEILMDVSPSVTGDRAALIQGARNLIGAIPADVEIAISQFAGNYRRLTEFTSDSSILKTAVSRLDAGVPGTCLFDALHRSLEGLKRRPGQKVLLVFSDGEDNCRDRFSTRGPLDADLSDLDGLYTAVRAAREAGTLIYVYNTAGHMLAPARTVAGGRPLAAPASTRRAYQGLAADSGGRSFDLGDLHGVLRAFEDLATDLSHLWVVDLDLPLGHVGDGQRRLALELPDSDGISLRFPQYWAPRHRESMLEAMLRSPRPEARLHAARAAQSSRDRDLLRHTLDALFVESDPANRRALFISVNVMTAHLLLHGDESDQKAAVAAAKKLGSINPLLLSRLQPALQVFQKMEGEAKLKKRARHLIVPQS